MPVMKVGSTVYLSLAGKTGRKLPPKPMEQSASSFGAELMRSNRGNWFDSVGFMGLSAHGKH
jgi:hypothetical protein